MLHVTNHIDISPDLRNLRLWSHETSSKLVYAHVWNKVNA